MNIKTKSSGQGKLASALKKKIEKKGSEKKKDTEQANAELLTSLKAIEDKEDKEDTEVKEENEEK